MLDYNVWTISPVSDEVFSSYLRISKFTYLATFTHSRTWDFIANYYLNKTSNFTQVIIEFMYKISRFSSEGYDMTTSFYSQWHELGKIIPFDPRSPVTNSLLMLPFNNNLNEASLPGCWSILICKTIEILHENWIFNITDLMFEKFWN